MSQPCLNPDAFHSDKLWCQQPILIASDHAGFRLKSALKTHLTDTLHLTVDDLGCPNESAVDYPEIAQTMALQIQHHKNKAGLLICGSGVGVSIAANRYVDVRAVLANDFHAAYWSRRHNNANILCLGGRVIAPELAVQLVELWLTTAFDDAHLSVPVEGRHGKRVAMMDELNLC